MDHSFLSALLLLPLALDPFGSLPIFVSMMRKVAPLRRTRVAPGGRAALSLAGAHRGGGGGGIDPGRSEALLLRPELT